VSDKPTCPTCGSDDPNKHMVDGAERWSPLMALLCCPDAYHRPQEPAQKCAHGQWLTNICSACPPDARSVREPAPGGDLERARGEWMAVTRRFWGMANGDRNPHPIVLAARSLIAAERADAARQERRRTLEEMKTHYRTGGKFSKMWFNERIREAGGE
jgi:hypothetical protein